MHSYIFYVSILPVFQVSFPLLTSVDCINLINLCNCFIVCSILFLANHQSNITIQILSDLFYPDLLCSIFQLSHEQCVLNFVQFRLQLQNIFCTFVCQGMISHKVDICLQILSYSFFQLLSVSPCFSPLH